MLHLTTASGERLEIPASSIVAVMQPSDGVNPCAIIFDIGLGPAIQQLTDEYGFVKRSVIDCMGLVNPIEVRILEGEEHSEGLLFFARDKIIGRREVKDSDVGINATLFLSLLTKPTSINVADTLDEMDGKTS